MQKLIFIFYKHTPKYYYETKMAVVKANLAKAFKAIDDLKKESKDLDVDFKGLKLNIADVDIRGNEIKSDDKNIQKPISGSDLVDFIRESVGLPKAPEGGWFRHLNKIKRIKKFDYRKFYPTGTMFLNAKNEIVIIRDSSRHGSLYSRIVDQAPIDQLYSLGECHFSKRDGLFTHCCLPNMWISQP